MEMDLESTLNKFRLYSGETMDESDPERTALCKGLCQECIRLVEDRLRTELTEEDAPVAEAVAAAEAFAQLALIDQASQPESVSTPELKLQQGDRARHAAALAEEKRRAAAALLREDGFYFGQA